ncbi:MAG: hypothetical protein OSA99_08225 [Acidimicrobiales bacterium]|nr:hypothetical protein [Acidimicrobiales bacterium]
MASVGEIAARIGVEEDDVAFLDAADPADRQALVEAIDAAGLARDRELLDAVDNALKFVPRPLRGRVLKLIGGGRG